LLFEGIIAYIAALQHIIVCSRLDLIMYIMSALVPRLLCFLAAK